MEAIAVFGGAAAILSIAVEFGKMGERLHKLVKTAPMAKVRWHLVVFSRSCLGQDVIFVLKVISALAAGSHVILSLLGMLLCSG